jgi:hypothetical protein
MITVYKTRIIPREAEIVLNNNSYFRKYTSDMLDNRALTVIQAIDGLDTIPSDPETLSDDCKTVLNILYDPYVIFNIQTCSEKAIEYIYAFDTANICSEIPRLPHDTTKMIRIYASDDIRFTRDIQEIYDWWSNNIKNTNRS